MNCVLGIPSKKLPMIANTNVTKPAEKTWHAWDTKQKQNFFSGISWPAYIVARNAT